MCRISSARTRLTGWLFLNINAQVFLESMNQGDFFDELLKATGFPAHRIVTEVLEQGVKDEVRLVEAVQFFRSKGFLIALDDFGAGHSNFDRIWSLQPDIVKLDRSMIARAGSNLRIRRMMPVMVSLLHEAGSLVLMEGIETESEALIAMDADADFVQGYYFARPQADLPPPMPAVSCSTSSGRISAKLRCRKFPARNGNRSLSQCNRLCRQPAGVRHSAGAGRRRISSSFRRRTLLSAGQRRPADRPQHHQRPPPPDGRQALQPLLNAEGANWSRRYYFRRALDHPGKVQVTRPYLSITGANQCITVSIGTLLNGEMLRAVRGRQLAGSWRGEAVRYGD